MENLTVNEAIVVDNYPYGRLKTKATFSIEFKPKKGFRSVFQTVNPKTGRINNPKKGVYHPIMFLSEQDGFVKFRAINYHDNEAYNRAMKFMDEHCPMFTDEQIRDIAINSLSYLKVSLMGSVQYGGCKFDDIKGYFEKAVKIHSKIAEIKHNMFEETYIDHEAIESHKPSNFNPFRVTKTELLTN